MNYQSIKDEIITLRRQIHTNPELAFEEYGTADLICSVLTKYNIPFEKGIAKTGVVATIGTKSDKVLLIRADIDALPIQEKTSLEFASKNEGIMHACGHDIHTASALAAAILLKEHESELNGSVKVVFQPAEEGVGGALPMIEEGIMNNPKVTCAIAGHVDPELDVGKITIKSGALMASPDDFMIKFIGKSTHGAQPQNGVSPLFPAAEMICEFKTLQNKLSADDRNVLSACTIKAEGGVNIIPEDAVIYGTFRSFTEEARRKADTTIKSTAERIAQKHGVSLEYKYNYMYPPVINDEAVTNEIIDISEKLFGKENVIRMKKPLMPGEDFSYYGKHAPSALFWYGAKSDVSYPLHSAFLVVNEDAIEIATSVFFEFAKNYLK